MYSTDQTELSPSGTPAAPLSRLERSLLRIWRARGLNRVFNRTMPLLPDVVRRRITGKRNRVQDFELLEQIRTRARLVPEEDLRALLARGLQALIQRGGAEALGDYLEFGVYNGTSLVCMYRELEALRLDRVRLFGFDSFEGFPPEAAVEDGGRWRPGSCHSTLEFTKAVLRHEDVDMSRVTLVPGWFSETLTEASVRDLRLTKASVIMIDCDLYSSTKNALTFCAPLIVDHALVLFDEWHARGIDHSSMGESRAFSEFLSEWPCFDAVPFGQYAQRTETFLLSRR